MNTDERDLNALRSALALAESRASAAEAEVADLDERWQSALADGARFEALYWQEDKRASTAEARVGVLEAALWRVGDIDSWKMTYLGGYSTDRDIGIFRHGMNTVCNGAKAEAAALSLPRTTEVASAEVERYRLAAVKLREALAKLDSATGHARGSVCDVLADTAWLASASEEKGS